MSKPLVLLRGPALVASGYGNHTKQIGDWLLSLEREGVVDLLCEPLPWGNCSWILDEKRDPVVGELMRRCRPLPRKPDFSFQVHLPNEWDPRIASYNVGITAAVETDRANRAWVDACRAMDAVVFPSVHSRSSLTNAGLELDDRVRVVPESYQDGLSSDIADRTLFDPLPPFTLLVFGQFTGNDQAKIDRKNIHNTVQWLLEEFVDDPDVGIVVKTNMGRDTTFDRYGCEVALRAIVERVKKKNVGKRLPEVTLIHGTLDVRELSSLYCHPHVRALVSATRGEGFGLPILEAAACGVPVIATGWSAHVEFLSHGKYVDLSYELKEIPKERVDKQIFVAGSRWAEVDENGFKRRVRKFRSSPSIPREWASALARDVRALYSPEAIRRAWEAEFGSRIRAAKENTP